MAYLVFVSTGNSSKKNYSGKAPPFRFSFSGIIYTARPSHLSGTDSYFSNSIA